MHGGKRYLGAVLVVGAASMAGRADHIKEQYQNLQELQRICCQLKSEIRYSRSYLEEAVSSYWYSKKSRIKNGFLFWQVRWKSEETEASRNFGRFQYIPAFEEKGLEDDPSEIKGSRASTGNGRCRTTGTDLGIFI